MCRLDIVIPTFAQFVFFEAEDGIRDVAVTGVQTCALPISSVPRSVAKPLDTNAACVTGTVNLLDVARKGGVKRVVYAGSSNVYCDLTASPAAYGLPTFPVLYFNIFGPRQDPNSEYSAVIPKFVMKMLAGERPTIFGDGKQSRDFTYVANVVAGNLLAAEVPAAAGKTFNIACGEKLDLLDLVAAINRVLGSNIEPIFAPPPA